MTDKNDYAEDAADAAELIAEFGQVGSLSRPVMTGPAHNPTRGTPDTSPATFAVLDIDARQVDGTRIKATDKRVVLSVSGLTLTPALTDTLIEADGSRFSIVVANPFRPAGVTVYHDLVCRR